MPVSRRRLLASLGVGATVATAGCGAVDRARSFAGGGATAPEGSLATAISDAIYAPGRCVDVEHKMLTVRNIASLREHGGNEVASGLVDRPTGKAEKGFDLDPTTVEGYAQYGPTEVFAGSFDRETVLENYRGDDWSVSETHHGVDILRHSEHPERYAGGVGDGVFFTTARYRATAAAEFVRAHAEALAGETERYSDDAEMGQLLSVIGGGDYVSAITSTADLGDRPPNTLAVGRALGFSGGDITDTMAFLFDESAPKSAAEYIETWGERWAEEVSSGPLSSVDTNTEGQVGYFSTTRPESAYTGDGRVISGVQESGPTDAMRGLVDERYVEDHGLEPPEATFTYRSLDDGAAVDCGEGSIPVAVTHESGEPILARRLGVGNIRQQEVYRFTGCGYGYDEEIEPGDTVRIGFHTPPGNSFMVYWNGPHGTTARIRTRSA